MSRTARLLFVLSVVLSTGAVAGLSQTAGTVTVGTGMGFPATTVDVPVNFVAGSSGVGTMQVDIVLPAALTVGSVSTGAAAAAAGKDVISNTAVAGAVRFLVFGLNANSLGSGSVAVLHTTVAAGTAPGQLPLTISSVVVSDPNGNPLTAAAVSGSVTVLATGDTTPPVLSAIAASSIDSTSATISWTTNEASDTQLQYGLSSTYGTTTTLNETKVTAHSQTLTGLAPGTLYHYRVMSRDAAGNRAVSTDLTFSTAPPSDSTPPVLSNILATSNTSTGATVTWTTDEGADSQVDYGTTASYGNSTVLDATKVTSHAVSLTGLTASTTYHYRVRCRDASGNPSVSGDYTFTTISAPDTTAPVISGVAAASITSTGATIVWTTNEAADSQVEYGATSVNDGRTPVATAQVTSHSVVLTGLRGSTTYHYRARSKDAAGNSAASADLTFSTGPNDTTPPEIISIGTTAGARNAVINWVTNEASDSQAEYGATASFGKASKLNRSLVVSHFSSVSGLKPNTEYKFRVKSRDASGNLAVSDTYSFKTTTASSAAVSMYYPRLVSQDGLATGLDGSEYTGIAVVNLGSIDAILTFTAYDTQGAEISGDDIVNPAEISLPPGTQLPVVDVELFGSGMTSNGRIGWIKLDSSAPGVTGFTLMFNSSLSVLDGAPVFLMPFVSSLLSEVEDEGFTQIHIANPNEEQVPVRIDLVRQDGTARASADRTVNGNGVIAEYLTELFPDTPVDASDYVRILSGKGVIPVPDARQSRAVPRGPQRPGHHSRGNRALFAAICRGRPLAVDPVGDKPRLRAWYRHIQAGRRRRGSDRADPGAANRRPRKDLPQGSVVFRVDGRGDRPGLRQDNGRREPHRERRVRRSREARLRGGPPPRVHSPGRSRLRPGRVKRDLFHRARHPQPVRQPSRSDPGGL